MTCERWKGQTHYLYLSGRWEEYQPIFTPTSRISRASFCLPTNAYAIAAWDILFPLTGTDLWLKILNPERVLSLFGVAWCLTWLLSLLIPPLQQLILTSLCGNSTDCITKVENKKKRTGTSASDNLVVQMRHWNKKLAILIHQHGETFSLTQSTVFVLCW